MWWMDHKYQQPQAGGWVLLGQCESPLEQPVLEDPTTAPGESKLRALELSSSGRWLATGVHLPVLQSVHPKWMG